MPVHLHEVDVNRTWLILHSRPRNSTPTYAQVNKCVRNNGFVYRNLSCAINLIGILVTATVLGNRPSIRQQKARDLATRSPNDASCASRSRRVYSGGAVDA
jgi:hypothetical protein